MPVLPTVRDVTLLSEPRAVTTAARAAVMVAAGMVTNVLPGAVLTAIKSASASLRN